jgi:hypothetical protein
MPTRRAVSRDPPDGDAGARIPRRTRTPYPLRAGRARALVDSEEHRAAPSGRSLYELALLHVTSAPPPGSPLDMTAAARVRLASGAVPPGTDPAGPAVARVRDALAATPVGAGWSTERALALAVELGDGGARPGGGGTTDLWEALATLAAADLGLARTVEPHLDALAILDQERAARGGGIRSRPSTAPTGSRSAARSRGARSPGR